MTGMGRTCMPFSRKARITLAVNSGRKVMSWPSRSVNEYISLRMSVPSPAAVRAKTGVYSKVGRSRRSKPMRSASVRAVSRM